MLISPRIFHPRHFAALVLPSSPTHPPSCRSFTRHLPHHSPQRCVHSQASNPHHAPPNSEDEAETHFGFQTVSSREKTSKVHQVFEQVASKYDQMNDAMSLGIHRLWKDQFVRMLSPRPGTKILDVAGGTGDIAFRLIKYMDYVQQQRPFGSAAQPRHAAPTETNELGLPVEKEPPVTDALRADVTVCDLSQSMLDVGRSRAQRNGLDTRIDWVCGNAEELPFPDDTFDAYTIAFGIRNVTHMDRALDEAYRVLKRGGRLMVLEFSQVQNPLLEWLYEKYSFQVIPVMGQLIASDWQSYQYLVESIRMFPNQEDFRQFIADTGFAAATFRNLTNGVCAIHSGFKL
ncbi:2-methoxy-6-polyprenyl-1,4-benzoquinol methylase, mitochondrial-like [Paramacrobiotus metropolitanus]|uniref:2-methoxy-6-polyprenyl-1,4-benzoquinol methylase, mitochondrial-like n=1 Tax=Paramacrobiotus metropolitanus TaxID=2943436 RepID=UPI0024462EF6|nr:2-methoxy-6-polyprenyl-1,4-benzoquinol methylase, mitochondrial-like [Paramacrobiotus metropolitanus]XP_055352307.1 2-methoxy-6-polyprenyl-1,4-benzoquinol methylase, mitochondrial-like [Paramacrobiotus metropolitanus]